VDSSRVRAEGLKLLARRELSVAGMRARLIDRGFSSADVESAIAALLESGALDDGRVAKAHARSAVEVKGRGRLRVRQELQQMGIHADVVAEALGEVFADVDERTLIARALQKRLRGRTKLSGPPEYARLYQYLMRQGFTPAGVTAALRRFRTGAPADHD
jgi:regulatory protein